MGFEVRTAPIHIAATPDQVFDVLVDYDSWRTWSPDFRISGKRAASGAGITIHVGFLPGPTLPAPGKLFVVESGRKLSWGGGIPVLLSLDHGFELRPDGDGTMVEHYERFGGVLGSASLPLKGVMTRAYERVNAGLREHVERLHA